MITMSIKAIGSLFAAGREGKGTRWVGMTADSWVQPDTVNDMAIKMEKTIPAFKRIHDTMDII